MKIKNVIIIIIIMTQINYKITARSSSLINIQPVCECGHSLMCEVSSISPRVKNGKWAFRVPANNDSLPIVYCIVSQVFSKTIILLSPG